MTDLDRREFAEALRNQILDVPINRFACRGLTRQTFATARALDFFDEAHLTNQIGHGPEQWRLALLKELIDNVLDAAEAAGELPAIDVTVTPETIAVTDNGGGMPEATLRGTLDLSVHTSDKRLYVAPTRGRLGNALLCLYAASYVASNGAGCVVVEAGVTRHQVTVSLDGIAGVPRLELLSGSSSSAADAARWLSSTLFAISSARPWTSVGRLTGWRWAPITGPST
jgi:hypothetical protein